MIFGIYTLATWKGYSLVPLRLLGEIWAPHYDQAKQDFQPSSRSVDALLASTVLHVPSRDVYSQCAYSLPSGVVQWLCHANVDRVTSYNRGLDKAPV